MKEKNAEISITFCLSGKLGIEVDLNEISERLNLAPARARTPVDWPEAIKNLKNELPDEYKPKYTWDYDVQYKECKVVSIRFEELLETLRGKEKIINELKERFALKASFVVGIHAQHDQCNLPEVFLTQEIITFAASIGAEIGFDMYLD